MIYCDPADTKSLSFLFESYRRHKKQYIFAFVCLTFFYGINPIWAALYNK